MKLRKEFEKFQIDVLGLFNKQLGNNDKLIKIVETNVKQLEKIVEILRQITKR